jgi:transcriptional regulator with XRE-family HTH domain
MVNFCQGQSYVSRIVIVFSKQREGITVSEVFKVNGGLIRYIRTQQRMSADELSSAATINTNYLYEIERNARRPSFKILLQIANALGVPFSLFLDGDDQGQELAESRFCIGKLEFEVPNELVEPIIKLITTYKGIN